ncbi:cation:proton antiporter [Lactiplantibacillus sp. WILCCON 0030]|uniref:Cation:proton antiporter n=1 Tax=Lactiplantibacillus brownii TaxID=3069269 RepID=A0ABU1A7R0_9LACO|nr:cation:proton antiporter [Lactiplantibacillus brownii]MDQ7936380.1 cation:proton antiporter [Lactiplantibacillus brownii]
MSFLGTLCILLLATTLAGHFSHRIGIPAVIGEILVGVVLGPAIFNLVHLTNLVQTFSDLGVIVLMFIGGLESNLALLKKYLRPAIGVAVIGVVFPVLIMGGVSHFFNFTWFESLFIGVIFSATSVSISVEVLKEFKALDTKEGATILGAAVADDIIGVILLSIMISMMGDKSGGAQPALWLVLLEQAAFFVGVFLLTRWIAPALMRLSNHLLMAVSPTIMSVIICLAMAWLAETVGLSGAIGAFFAGTAIAQTDYQHQVDVSIEPVGYTIFIPIFFVSVGLNMTFEGFWQSLPFVAVMTVLGVLTKLLGCGLGAKLNGFNAHSNYLVGAGMISRGEMALITAQIGFSAHLLSSNYYSDVILVIILVTMIAPFVLKDAIHRAPATRPSV